MDNAPVHQEQTATLHRSLPDESSRVSSVHRPRVSIGSRTASPSVPDVGSRPQSATDWDTIQGQLQRQIRANSPPRSAITINAPEWDRGSSATGPLASFEEVGLGVSASEGVPSASSALQGRIYQPALRSIAGTSFDSKVHRACRVVCRSHRLQSHSRH